MRTGFITFALALSSTMVTAQSLSSGIDKANMDLSVKPGDNFYRYAAGGWLKNNPLDGEHPMNGAFVDLEEQNQKHIQELITQYSGTPQKQGTLEQKIGSLYNLMMDSTRLNKEGIAPLKPYLDRINAIKSKPEYQVVVAQLSRLGITGYLFSVGVSTDIRNSTQNLVEVGQGGISLPRDFYVKDDEQSKIVRKAYKDYVKTLFEFAGYDSTTAKAKAETTFAIENRLAKAHYDNVKLRDIEANYHKMTYADFVAKYPGIDWGDVFLMEGYPKFDQINVGQPEAIEEAEKVLAETSLDDLKTYAEAKALKGASSKLDDKFRAASFKFQSIVSGTTQDRPRWKRAVDAVSGTLGEAIGKLYVEKYFPASSKERMLQMVKNLQVALGQRIDEAKWMSDATKAQAHDKLNNFIIKIGYPDKWKSYDGLQVVDSLPLLENMARITEYLSLDFLSRKVNKPVDKTEWGMTPQTVNAYYDPTSNEICFPAAILQPPFFNPTADEAANYGAIGVVIGHEMSHGFDDQGCQFDKTGNQRNWWTEADKRNYDKRTKVLADHFDTYEVLPGKKVNGKQTLGENIGDNGGLNISLRAMHNSMKTHPLGVIDGFTPDQRFFLSYARIWAGNASPQIIDYLLKSDVHSPNEARVNGALPNIDEWYKAFNIKRGSKLYLPKSKRAHIW